MLQTKFRKLTHEDSGALEELITVIESNLENKYFWLPIKEEARKHFWDEEWTEFYGLFQDGRLVAAAALFFNEYEFGESREQLKLNGECVAEIGRVMVHPKYRGNDLACQLIQCLIDIAKQKNIEYVLATIHPQNVPSQRAFQKAGLKKMCTYVKNDTYVRDIYVMEYN